MEDKLEGFPQPNKWIPDLKGYIPGEQVYPDLEPQTSICRGLEAAKVIDKHLKGTNPLSALIVGLGYNSDPFVCSYEPYQIAAYLQSRQVSYQLTLIDKNRDAIVDVLTRRHIILPSLRYQDFPSYREAWQLYLERTQQTATSTNSLSIDVKMAENSNSKARRGDVNNELRAGILLAEIPSSYRDGLTSGKIHTISGAIETAPIQNYAPYNFISCTNLLYLLNEDGQKLALVNMSRALGNKGYMLINCRYGAFIPKGYDRKKYTGAPLFPEHGGWMTSEKLRGLGLKVVEQSPENADGYITAVIQKD